MNDENRYRALDAIRGVAALIVVLGHCYGVLPAVLKESYAFLKNPPFLLLTNGRAAVMVFFVLSGFVLALPYWRDQAPSYPVFVLRRICRIYIPFAAAVILSAVAFSLVAHEVSGTTDWAERIWGGRSLSAGGLAGHFLMTGIWDHIFLNSPVWSLVHEMRISLLFPLLVLCCRSTAGGMCAAAITFLTGTYLAATQGGFRDFPIMTDNFAGTLAATVAIMPAFIFGILLARHRDAVTGRLLQMPGLSRVLLWVACLACFSVIDSFRYAPLMMLGAVLLLALTLSSAAAKRVLLNPVLQWLGKVSYSLYLVHVPVLFTVIMAGRDIAGYGTLLLASVILSLGAAALLHGFVERPALALSRRLAGRTSP
jgi:peptidoglycan/LPS O-acetylase OafA/YrhL